MKKAELLFNAYKSRKEIEPFPLTEDEAKKVKEEFIEILINSEGLGGYKLSGFGEGVLTKPMITRENTVELWFRNHKLEVEIVTLVENGEVKRTFLGLEIPAPRFTTWDLPSHYIVADNIFAARLYVGPEIDPPFGSFKLYINDKFVGEGEPKYKPEEKVKEYMKGYVSLGVFIGPTSVKKGDKIRVEGKKSISVSLI
ncbi:hypothetical protein [Saccharolobus islandicus]|jgi:hypothetical protein|uniref:2-keto-4-pentenoate hydratase n=4 Tax=Saccharolobus islandicus TaxID=43080 RepID=M9U6Y6_SACIS|nr:hypothetical protein [Sulfolobus islandicus]ACP49557.1 conserved hypothetical protein [Sulfolobus islandicus Y.N.15.51]ADX82342.1 conserved hypothetical protein [Sulfolobus islandicus HVE10/4]ADX84491.1 conserved hypothetical protein [Sulfolobus islandicus REY15A]AGJ61902.1 Hypothetical Protein SiL_0429 [Sulfolobus islandicus LAL14/1]PVU77815.1 2-keto-4-pentenoate hydratase [Sulfolobus islandicus]